MSIRETTSRQFFALRIDCELSSAFNVAFISQDDFFYSPKKTTYIFVDSKNQLPIFTHTYHISLELFQHLFKQKKLKLITIDINNKMYNVVDSPI